MRYNTNRNNWRNEVPSQNLKIEKRHQEPKTGCGKCHVSGTKGKNIPLGLEVERNQFWAGVQKELRKGNSEPGCGGAIKFEKTDGSGQAVP